MQTIAQTLTQLLAQAVADAGYRDAPFALTPVQPSRDPDLADYQSTHAMRLAKWAKEDATEVAEAIIAKFPDDDNVCGAVTVAGRGFINFRINDIWLGNQVKERAADPRLACDKPADGLTMVIDYSSPNIAKRMHVGHLRSTIIGNALHRIHAFLGWKVVADNHLGDWGTQFGKLIVAWHEWRDEIEDFDADPVGNLQRLYVMFGERADDALQDRARAETALLQQGDDENRALWRRFVDISLEEFNAIYARLGVSFDVMYGESHYRDGLQALIDRLLAEEIAVIDDGAAIVPFDGNDGKGLKKNPLLIRKSDGAALYGTTDLATLELRTSEFDPDSVVYVTDVRQQLHFRQVFAAARKAGLVKTGVNLEHVWFGMLRFAGGEVMATRAGGAVNLVDLLDTARDRALAVIRAEADFSDEERLAIAEAVGVGAVIYQDLSQNPQSDLLFDWDKMLALQGNTAPYVMYAHARCRSIYRKSGLESIEATELWITDPTERDLALLICRTPEVIENAARLWRPNMVADHLFAITSAFGSFYEACPVLKADTEVLRDSRLTLTLATATTLKIGLELLGLTALERM